MAALNGMLGQLGHIAYFIVLPILVLVALGYLLQRRLGLDMPTMTRLNFHFIIPAVIYAFVVSSDLTAGDVALVVVFEVLFIMALAAVAFVAGWIRRLPEDQRRVLMMSTMFHNSGNYGIPLQQLTFRGPLEATAVSMQVFVMMVQNVAGYTVGVFLASHQPHWRQSLQATVRFPPLWALLAAIITVAIRRQLDVDTTEHLAHLLSPFWQIIQYIREAFIAVALCTLGAQLALVRRNGIRYPVTLSIVLRLMVGPAIGFAIIRLMGLEGLMAQVLLISTTTPTSVNSLLMCLQFGNHPDFIARSVFYSTLISPITVAVVVLLVR
jgi:malate permease and related proteins